MTKHNTTPAASASRHTPEPWSMEAGAHRILFRGRIPFYSERVLLVKAGNALAGLNPEAVKDVVGFAEKMELCYFEALNREEIIAYVKEQARAALAALKKP